VKYSLAFWHFKQRVKYWLWRIVLVPWRPTCNWHRGDYPVEEPFCPDCGSLLWTKTCKRCGHSFLDWTAQGFDDVCGAPEVTEGGDLVCARCAEIYREEEEQEYEEEFGYWDEVETAFLSRTLGENVRRER